MKIHESQAVYMPCVPSLVAKHLQALRAAGKASELIEEKPLFLPSEVNVEMLDLCEPGVSAKRDWPFVCSNGMGLRQRRLEQMSVVVSVGFPSE